MVVSILSNHHAVNRIRTLSIFWSSASRHLFKYLDFGRNIWNLLFPYKSIPQKLNTFRILIPSQCWLRLNHHHHHWHQHQLIWKNHQTVSIQSNYFQWKRKNTHNFILSFQKSTIANGFLRILSLVACACLFFRILSHYSYISVKNVYVPCPIFVGF